MARAAALGDGACDGRGRRFGREWRALWCTAAALAGVRPSGFRVLEGLRVERNPLKRKPMKLQPAARPPARPSAHTRASWRRWCRRHLFPGGLYTYTFRQCCVPSVSALFCLFSVSHLSCPLASLNQLWLGAVSGNFFLLRRKRDGVLLCCSWRWLVRRHGDWRGPAGAPTVGVK